MNELEDQFITQSLQIRDKYINKSRDSNNSSEADVLKSLIIEVHAYTCLWQDGSSCYAD